MKANELRQKLENINQTHGKKYHLVNMGWKKFWLYNGDFAKWIGGREKKGTIEYLQGYIDWLFNL